MTIDSGAKDVDPALKETVIHFDRAMKTNHYAVARTSKVEQPKMGKVSFDETGRVFTIIGRRRPLKGARSEVSH